MGLVVQKYRGSSVADAERIKRVAERIVKREGIDLAKQIVPVPDGREFDAAADGGRAHLDGLLAMATNSLAATPSRSPARWPASSPPPSTAVEHWSLGLTSPSSAPCGRSSTPAGRTERTV